MSYYFSTPGGGSNGVTEFDASVGATGADYTTISAALAASKTRLLAIDNVTETADCTIPASGLYIYALKGKTINFNTNAVQFTRAGAYNLTVEGQDKTSVFGYAFSSAKNLVDGSTGISSFSNITITNTSTNTLTSVTNGDPEEHYSNVTINVPNQNFAGISAYNVLSTLDNVEIVGGGVACDNALDLEAAVRGNNILISGTFKTTGGLYIGNGSSITNINFNNTGAMYCGITVGAMVTNLYQNSGALIIQLGNDAKLNNAYLLRSGGVAELTGVRADVIGVQAVDLTATSVSASNNNLVACRISNAVTFAGDRNKMTNCDFLGGATTSSGADNNGFFNSQFGADAGAGALTLNITSGSLNTRVVGCMSDVAIVNGDASSILSANSIY